PRQGLLRLRPSARRRRREREAGGSLKRLRRRDEAEKPPAAARFVKPRQCDRSSAAQPRPCRRKELADFIVRAIERGDRAQWEPLWRAYLDFYRTAENPEATTATGRASSIHWSRCMGSSPHAETG